ncbi:hypothetical protein IBTHAUMO2_760006 [Nitrosopumilaceae archaeon]|nr:hypothetical protein IBTHAUMO2_760006 [Nitrosopumilaceae archaeon]
MIRRPPRSTLDRSSAASDVYKRQYLNDLNPFDLGERGGDLEWDAVIGWRIATYYFPILVTWLLLVKLALSRIKGGTVEAAQ